MVTGIVTVFFGVWEQGRDRQEEHRRWLRDKRHEAYAALIADALSVHTSLPLADPDSLLSEEVGAGLLREARGFTSDPVALLAREPAASRVLIMLLEG